MRPPFALTAALTAALAGAPPGESPGARAPIAEAWVFAPEGEARAALAGWPVGFAESIEGPLVLVHAEAETFDAMAAAGWTLQGRRADHRLPPPPDGGGGPSPEEVLEALEALAAAHPERAELIDLGRSREGRPVVALRAGTEGAPSLRVVGGHHGDEPPSVTLALAVARALLEEAPGFEGLLDTREVWLLPALNPDGLAAGTRYNADGVDLNRNYGFSWSAGAFGAGPEPFSEPETRAARALGLRAAPLAGLSLHTGAENIGYVYNHTPLDTVEEDRLEALGHDYAEACGQLAFPVVQGAEWYVTLGDANDWSFGVGGALDYTVELSREKAPAAAVVEALVEDHLPAVAAFLAAEVPLDLTAVSALEGGPLPVVFELEGLTTPALAPAGRLQRHVEPGPARLRVVAEGHAPRTLDLDLPAQGTVTLQPAEDLHPVRPEPALLLRGDAAFTLPGLAPLPDTLTLSQPGHEPVDLRREGEAYPVSVEALAPGAWTLTWADGVAPRALLVGSDQPGVGLTGVERRGEALHVSGFGLGRGSRALVLHGALRLPRPLPVLSEGEGELVLDASTLPAEGTVDLLLWSAGVELPVVDLLDAPFVDPGLLPGPSLPGALARVDASGAQRAGYGGCHTSPRAAGPLGLAPLLLLLPRRRRCASR